MISLDIGALVVGAIGIALAIGANRRAEQANKHSQVANNLAADAVAKAAIANRIAEEANQLSQDANTVIRAQAARESERWHVDWRVEWDEETSALSVVNVGADAARQPILVIQGEDLHDVLRRDDDLAPGGEIVFALPQLVEKRATYDVERRQMVEDLHRSGIAYFAAGFSMSAALTITWLTGEGGHGQATRELKLS